MRTAEFANSNTELMKAKKDPLTRTLSYIKTKGLAAAMVLDFDIPSFLWLSVNCTLKFGKTGSNQFLC